MLCSNWQRCYIAAALGVVLVTACVDSPTVPSPMLDAQKATAALVNKPPLDETLEGQAWVCKDGVAATAPEFKFSVSVDGGPATNFEVLLGTCVLVHSVPIDVSNSARVSVTETVLPDWTLTSIRIESEEADLTPLAPSINPPNAAATISNDFGAVFTFTNTFTPPPPPPPPPNLEGRMTGGGAQIFGGVKITRGFTVHCDLTLSNNVEINWDKNQWHIDKPLTKATCINDPAYQQQPPNAPFNTFIGEGIGRLNGVDGSKIIFTFIDAGEPGKFDKAAIRIIAPDGITMVLNVPLVFLDNGNIQAHFDQPHGFKP